MLWRCSVCGFLHYGDDAPDSCPKCDAPKDKFEKLTDEDAEKIFKSDRTNDIHMEIVSLAMRIKDLAKEGIELDLDPPCLELFKRAHKEAWIIKQRSKAEVESHMKKGKW